MLFRSVVIECGVIASFRFASPCPVASCIFALWVEVHSVGPATGFQLSEDQGIGGGQCGLQVLWVTGSDKGVQQCFADGRGAGWLDPDFRGRGSTFTASLFEIERYLIDVATAYGDGVCHEAYSLLQSRANGWDQLSIVGVPFIACGLWSCCSGG